MPRGACVLNAQKAHLLVLYYTSIFNRVIRRYAFKSD